MMRRFLIVMAIVALVTTRGYSQQSKLDSLPAYQPEHKVVGLIRNYGNNVELNPLRLWELAFLKHQGDTRFSDKMSTTAEAIGGLFTGLSDVAHMGHTIWLPDLMAFNKFYG